MSQGSLDTRTRIFGLVLVPAIITLAITLLRLVGELRNWSPALFGKAAGGGGALIGISWLPPIFGVHFALKLVRAGEGPARRGRAIAFALASLLALPLTVAVGRAVGAPFAVMIGVLAVTTLAGAWVACQGWPALGQTLFVYALLARVPVALLMLPAILGNWGTHYDVRPPNFPPVGPFATWLLIGLVPQLTLWIGLTISTGMVTGTIAAALARSRPPDTVASAA
jgi:hypothetical protein